MTRSEQIERAYAIRCMNEWCSGPETFAYHDEKPRGPVPCPTCGWLALPSDGASVVEIAEASHEDSEA